MAAESSISISPHPHRLLGVVYGFTCGEVELLKVRRDADARAAVEAAQEFLEDRKTEFKGFEPVASRGGLLALRRPSMPAVVLPGLAAPPPSELCVCNPVAGQHVSLWRPTICDESFVLLPDGTGGFRLHVLNLELADAGMLQNQTFSSAERQWGSVVATYAHLPVGSPSRFLRPSPLVLGNVAYWLCKSESKSLGYHVLALPLDGQRQPAPIKLPDKVLQTRGPGESFDAEDLLLASTMVNGTRRLTLAVVTNITVSLWTLDDDNGAEKPARWTRHEFFDLWRIMLDRECPPPSRDEGERLALECFSEASGGLLFHFYHHMLYKLDLQTREVEFVGVYCKRSSTNMCDYEISYVED